MSLYPKIHTLFKRDMNDKRKTLIFGQWARPEFDYLQNNLWEWTEKVDGTNIRLEWDGTTIQIGGRTENAQLPAPLVARIQERFPTPEIFATVFDGPATIFCEGYGPKIQSGECYRSDQDIIVFDVRVGKWWLNRSGVTDVAEKLGLDVVPVVGYGTLQEMIMRVRDGLASIFGNFFAEGIVARTSEGLLTRSGERIMAKIKRRDFPQEDL